MEGKSVDFLIIGQGLAGTILANRLLSEGKTVQIVADTEGGASSIAAGVINPVTGRRIVKSWRYEEFYAAAKTVYQDLEKENHIKVWHDFNILRTLKNAEDENKWTVRSSWAEYAPYCLPDADPSVFAGKIKEFYGFGEITTAAQVDIPQIIDFFKEKWLQNGILINDSFDFESLIIEEKNVQYKPIQADKIIFAEGAKGVKNPYFSYLPFNVDKGECLIIEIKNADFNKIFKNHIAIVPLSKKDHFWVGGTSEWDATHTMPTPEKRLSMETELRNILTVDFKIIAHQAAIRPSVKDRRPMIGVHPKFSNVFIFNGFGTKGASLIPFWAAHLVEVLENKTEIDGEVDILRFLR